jgi:hypothetical protein
MTARAQVATGIPYLGPMGFIGQRESVRLDNEAEKPPPWTDEPRFPGRGSHWGSARLSKSSSGQAEPRGVARSAGRWEICTSPLR